MNRKNTNPFIYQGYNGPEYFCDREEETRSMASALYNGRNITLISPRRLGKTGLIWHTFQHIQSENRDAICLYIDIFPTKNQQELASMLGSAVLNTAMSKGKAFGKKVLDLMAAMRPVVGMDSMTGLPNVTVNIDPTQSEVSLGRIFNQLNHLEKEVFVAIDEFQQIAAYPETGTEALLRSHIQFLNNVHFVFSGS
jgi:AAA+ ATPase superfamily predicted ATPase